jgi:hypothetical protein
MKVSRILLGCLVISAGAQTHVNLGKQGTNADFSSIGATRVFQTGTALPATCAVGQSYFKTDAAPGANLYGCTGANTWTVISAAITNYGVDFHGQTTVTIPGGTHNLGSSNLLVGCYASDTTPPRTIEPNSVAIDPVSFDVTITFAAPQNGRCVINGTGGATAAAGGGNGSGTDLTLQSAPGVSVVENGSTVSVGVDTASVPTYLSAVQNTMIGPIATGSCWQGRLPLPGAAQGDAVAAGWPASLSAGLLGTMWVGSANTVTVQVCNLSGAAVPAWSDLLRAIVVRSF